MSKHTPRRFILAILFLTSLSAAAQAQSLPSIAVVGTPQALTLTAADLATEYEGVWISEVLKRAGVRLGEALRGTDGRPCFCENGAFRLAISKDKDRK